MAINMQTGSNPLTIELNGTLDGASAPDLCERFFNVSRQTEGDVIVDIGAVDFMDSVGLGLLVSFYRQLSAKDRRLHVAGATGQPNDLLRITGSDRVLCVPIADDAA